MNLQFYSHICKPIAGNTFNWLTFHVTFYPLFSIICFDILIISLVVRTFNSLFHFTSNSHSLLVLRKIYIYIYIYIYLTLSNLFYYFFSFSTIYEILVNKNRIKRIFDVDLSISRHMMIRVIARDNTFIKVLLFRPLNFCQNVKQYENSYHSITIF